MILSDVFYRVPQGRFSMKMVTNPIAFLLSYNKIPWQNTF